MKFKIGDEVRIIEEGLYEGCEGKIVDFINEGYLVELFKSNGIITEEEMEEYDIYFIEEALELIVKLNIKELRKIKNTTFISTEESLKGISRWLKFEDEE